MFVFIKSLTQNIISDALMHYGIFEGYLNAYYGINENDMEQFCKLDKITKFTKSIDVFEDLQ